MFMDADQSVGGWVDSSDHGLLDMVERNPCMVVGVCLTWRMQLQLGAALLASSARLPQRNPTWRSGTFSLLQASITAQSQAAPPLQALYESGDLWPQTPAQAQATALKWPRSRRSCCCSRALLGGVQSGKNGCVQPRSETLSRGLSILLTSLDRSLL